MNIRRTPIKSIFPYFILAIGIIVFIAGLIINGNQYEILTNQSIIAHQIVQFLSLFFLFIIGYVFLKIIQDILEETWIILLSFPAGLCLYVFCSNIFLLCDFTLRIERVIIAIFIFLASLLFVRLKILRKKLAKPTNKPLSYICIIVGCILMVSSGLIYIIVNYDSFFYFLNYGTTIAKYLCYKDFVSDNSYVLTNIGQFLPISESYFGFWGISTIYAAHHLLFFNTSIFFGYSIYDYCINIHSRKKSVILSIFATVMLLTSSPFFLFGNWILSNSWIMFFTCIAFILSCKFIINTQNLSLDLSIIISGLSLAITMLRKDGLIYVCVFFIYLSIAQSVQTKAYLSFKHRFCASLNLAVIFLPSLLYTAIYIYLLKNVLYATTRLAVGTSLLSSKSTILLLSGLAILIYLTILYIPAERLFNRFLPHVATIVLVGILCLYAYKNFSLFIDYIDVWTRNLSGIAFGYTIIQLLILTTILLSTEKKYDNSFFFIIAYILITLAIYWNKENLEIDIDNSGLRALCQVIPCIYYLGATRLFSRRIISNK